jgi:putative transposase
MLADITRHSTAEWMVQMARNSNDPMEGNLDRQRYALHDRDGKFCAAFREILRSNGVRPLMLPPHSPNLNAFAERWVRSVKEECLAKVIPFGEPSLRRALNEFVDHYHGERNHQGKENKLLFQRESIQSGPVHCRERLGGLLKYYVRAA